MDINSAQQAWEEACDTTTPDHGVKALFGGGNYRVDVAKTLKAVYLSAKLYLDGKLALATGSIGPVEIAKLGKVTWDLIMATLNAVRERMHPAEYLICLVLSSRGTAGEVPTQLQAEVMNFLIRGAAEQLPWYMGLSTKALDEARKALEDPGGFELLVTGLKDDGLVLDQQGVLLFKQRHFQWGFTVS